MLSLDERIKQRAKRKAAEDKARGMSPTQGVDESDESEGEFNPIVWVNDTVENIVSAMGDLSDDELSAVEQAEAGRKNRVSVMNAIAEDKKRRQGSATGWNQDAG